MLVKLRGVWLDHLIWVNPAHVKTLRPAILLVGPGYFPNALSRRFPIAGQTLIEYSVDAGDGELHTDTVWGTLDEVAKQLNIARRQQAREMQTEAQ